METEHAVDQPVELTQYLRILWRRRWLIVLMFAVAAGAALGLSSRREPQYSATAKVFIGPQSSAAGDVGTAIQELTFSQEFVASYAELLKGRVLAERVVEKEGLALEPTALTGRIRTSIVPETRIISVSVSDSSPDRARTIANSIVRTFVTDTLPDYGGRAGVSATVVEPALTPEDPVSPKPVRDGILGGILGLMLGVGLAFVLERLDTSMRSRDQVEAAIAPTPMLAAVPEFEAVKGEDQRRLYVKDAPRSQAAEAFRILRTNLQFLGVDHPVRRVLVTSPFPEDGKSTIAANLAAALGVAGSRTILIDADLHRPTLHHHVDVPATPGMTEILVGRAELNATLQPTKVPKLMLLPCGPLPPNPSELLGSHRMHALLADASAMADIVVIDTPPALHLSDAVSLSAHTDGVILVIRAGKTTRDQVREAIASFERVGKRVLGVVLNRVPAGEQYGYYYGYSYYADRIDDQGIFPPQLNGSEIIAPPPGAERLGSSPQPPPGPATPP